MTTAPTYMSTWNTSWTSVSITKNTIAYHHLTPQTFMETFKMCRRWFLVLSLKASPANCSLTANNTRELKQVEKKGEVLGWMENTTAYNPTAFPLATLNFSGMLLVHQIWDKKRLKKQIFQKTHRDLESDRNHIVGGGESLTNEDWTVDQYLWKLIKKAKHQRHL